MKCSRYLILLMAMECLLCVEARAQLGSLEVELRGDHLRISTPQLHFLEGKALERLHNGSTVTYIIALTAGQEHARTPAFRLQKRFIISFDLWEEKYSVVQSEPGGSAASHLTAIHAEAWCLEAMPVPLGVIPAQQPFVIKLECFVEKNEEEKRGENRSGLTLAGLIDIFSRRKSEAPLHWEASAGPLRLSDLKRSR
jgi:hypothetical protein